MKRKSSLRILEKKKQRHSSHCVMRPDRGSYRIINNLVQLIQELSKLWDRGSEHKEPVSLCHSSYQNFKFYKEATISNNACIGLGRNLVKLCTIFEQKNYKTLLKNIKEGQNKLTRYTMFTGEKNWRNKTDNSLKLIYKFNLISTKSQQRILENMTR